VSKRGRRVPDQDFGGLGVCEAPWLDPAGAVSRCRRLGHHTSGPLTTARRATRPPGLHVANGHTLEKDRKALCERAGSRAGFRQARPTSIARGQMRKTWNRMRGGGGADSRTGSGRAGERGWIASSGIVEPPQTSGIQTSGAGAGCPA